MVSPSFAFGLFLVFVSSLILPSMSTWILYNDFNAVVGAGLKCDNSTKPYVCLGNYPDIFFCQRACVNNKACTIASWSNRTHNCWMRSDGKWDPVSWVGVISVCDDTRVKSCIPQPYNGPVTVGVSTSTILGRTHPLSPAVTLDFWRSDDVRFGQKWNHSGAIEIDLTNPQVPTSFSSHGEPL